jgi:propanol-preferring alcohol dehydrogenase
MKAMQLQQPGSGRVVEVDIDRPRPAEGQVLIRVTACGVCRTDLHVVDGELPDPRVPLVPGHEIVGRVVSCGEGVEGLETDRRVGVPWLGYTCGDCVYCNTGRENLCAEARFTGYQIDGGYAEYTVADHRYVFPLPGETADPEAAPLLCAGLIGYRAYRAALESVPRVDRLGLYGFGAAAHILAQVALHEGREIYAFTRPGDEQAAGFARGLGATWAGGSDESPPQQLDAAILFAPVGSLVPAALEAVARGGVVVCAGIHMSDIPSFPYRILWEERIVRSVANLTRRDGEEFLPLATRVPVETTVVEYALTDADRALDDLREGRFSGAAVLVP